MSAGRPQYAASYEERLLPPTHDIVSEPPSTQSRQRPLFCVTSLSAISILALFAFIPPPKAPSPPLPPSLLAGMQQVLDDLASQENCAASLAFIANGTEYTLVAGTHEPVSPTNITANDTFLFGSGTKALVATRVMQLVEAGELSLDDTVQSVLDPVLRPWVGVGFDGLFAGTGHLAAQNRSRARKMTVGQTIRMATGLSNSLESPVVTRRTLWPTDPKRVWTPVEFINWTTSWPSKAGPFFCGPAGQCNISPLCPTCHGYSSTNFQIAGLIILAVQQRKSPKARLPWQKLDMGPLFRSAAARRRYGAGLEERYSDMYFFRGDERLKDHMTIPALQTMMPGFAGPHHNKSGPEALYIWNQTAASLGWTCGNLVAPPLQVARFFYDLLGPEALVVSQKTVQLMTGPNAFAPLIPFPKQRMQYGIGMMNLTVPECVAGGRCSYIGHGGNTWGSVTANGWFYELGVAWSLGLTINDVDLLDRTTTTLIEMVGQAADELPPPPPMYLQDAAIVGLVAVGLAMLLYALLSSGGAPPGADRAHGEGIQ